jgi:cytochrome bd-type quinol oxidase subunit 2
MSKLNLPEMMSYIIGAVFMVIVFSIAYAYLKPHRMHHARPLSTLALKGSYLIYLLAILLVIYLASLRGGGVSQVFDGPEFFIFLVVLFVPTAGIFSRKIERFSGKRIRYNLIFTAVNLLMAAVALVLYRF